MFRCKRITVCSFRNYDGNGQATLTGDRRRKDRRWKEFLKYCSRSDDGRNNEHTIGMSTSYNIFLVVALLGNDRYALCLFFSVIIPKGTDGNTFAPKHFTDCWMWSRWNLTLSNYFVSISLPLSIAFLYVSFRFIVICDSDVSSPVKFQWVSLLWIFRFVHAVGLCGALFGLILYDHCVWRCTNNQRAWTGL